MNAYETAQQLGLTGTDSEIVAALKANGLTARPIRLDELLFLLNNRGMLVRLIRPADTGEKWAGTVVNMVLWLNGNGTTEQAFAVNQWFSHITNDRNNLFDTTNPLFASSFWSLSQLLAGGQTMPSSEDFEAVAALGGGWLFAGLTVEQFAEQKAAADAAAERQAIINACIDPITAAHSAAAAKLNNAQASLGPEHTDGLTLEELQARCDAITASATGEV